MSAAELRKAAETLRERAEKATPGAWINCGQAIGVTVQGCTCAGTAPGYPQHESYCGTDGPIIDGTEPDIAYIATLPPGVGLALADLLEHASARAASKIQHGGDETAVWSHERDALTLARLINGGAS